MKSVAVIIPFYNGDEYILSCLKSVYSGFYAQCMTYIINNSTEPTRIHDLAGIFPMVHVVDTLPRSGFGKACTLGADRAVQDGADFLVILNQDTIVAPECLKNLVDTLSRHEDLAITAPIQFKYDFQGIEEFFIRWYVTQCPELFNDSLQGCLKEYYDMVKISGACFAIKSSLAIRFGLFDPLYFMYFEDEDLCRRLLHLDYRIGLVPRASVAHAHSHTTTDHVLRQKIERSKRRSFAIYRLKDYQEYFIISVVKWIIDNFCDYTSDLLHLRFNKAISDIFTDTVTLFQIRRIAHSRLREIRYQQDNAHALMQKSYDS